MAGSDVTPSSSRVYTEYVYVVPGDTVVSVYVVVVVDVSTARGVPVGGVTGVDPMVLHMAMSR